MGWVGTLSAAVLRRNVARGMQALYWAALRGLWAEGTRCLPALECGRQLTATPLVWEGVALTIN